MLYNFISKAAIELASRESWKYSVLLKNKGPPFTSQPVNLLCQMYIRGKH